MIINAKATYIKFREEDFLATDLLILFNSYAFSLFNSLAFSLFNSSDASCFPTFVVELTFF